MTKAQLLAALKLYKAKEDTVNDGKFVAKVAGKDLSTNDYTTAEKDKLAGVAEGADVSVITGVQVDGTDLTVTDKKVNIDLSAYAKTTDLSTVYRYKGTVATFAALPTADQVEGDVYNVEAADATNGIKAGDNVAWNGTSWDNLSGAVDLSGYVAKEDGKGLSSTDVTAEMVAKWNAAASAEADVTQEEIDSIFTTETAGE